MDGSGQLQRDWLPPTLVWERRLVRHPTGGGIDLAIAEIHGKTPFDYYEDLLTADVFAAFRYLPADAGVIGFLRSIENLAEFIARPDANSTCELHFWPLGELCNREPDLLLELDIGGRLYHVVVEAKYMSGPSDGEDVEIIHQGEPLTLGNQLGDQFRDLLNGEYLVYRGAKRIRRKRLASRVEDRLQLYLTAHVFRPQEELDLAVEYCPESRGRLFWANWYQVYDYLGLTGEKLERFPYSRIIGDLCALLDRKQFSSFHGVEAPPDIDMEGVAGSFWEG